MTDTQKMPETDNTVDMADMQDRAAQDAARAYAAQGDEADDALEYDAFSDGIDGETATIDEAEKGHHVITALQKELAETKEQNLRLAAEAENTRRRARKDRDDASKFAISSFSRDLLSVADNLRRALEAVPAELLEQNETVKNLVDGIEATERELLRSFEKNKIKKIVPIDLPFDPNFHEVMFEAPMPDKPHGTVIQVLEAGYVLNDRILRPARVGISRNDAAQSAPSPEAGSTIDTQA